MRPPFSLICGRQSLLSTTSLCQLQCERASSSQANAAQCAKGLQDNLLMGSRGRGLPILSISIRLNCWLLLHTHTHYHIFFWNASKATAYNQPCIFFFCLKMLHHISLLMTDDFLAAPQISRTNPPLRCPQSECENENTTGQQFNSQVEPNSRLEIKLNQFYIIKTSLIEHFLFTIHLI